MIAQMAIKLMLSLILLTTINCEKQTYDESEFKVDYITLLSNYPFGSQLEAMKNVSFHCYAKFKCGKIICGEDLPPIQWLLPRELREFQLLYGINSTRVQFNRQSTAWLNNNTTFLIRSAMFITDIGTIHNGSYSCSHELLGVNADFSVKVNGMDAEKTCHFEDQCRSHNCNNEKCKCNQENQVFITQQNKCLPASKWNTSCKYDEQCSYTLPSGANKCIENVCDCEKGYTACTIPMRGKICSKIKLLDESCSHKDQCSESDINSYCSIKSKCECKTGYHSVSKKCVAYQKCDSSQLGFNDNYIQGDCPTNEFCRNSICLCLPNYLVSDGNCQNPHTNDNNEHWYNTYGYYVIGGMSGLLVLMLCIISYQIVKYKRESRRPHSRANSSDPLNREPHISHLRPNNYTE